MVIGRERQKNWQTTTAPATGGSVSGNYLRGITNYLVQRQLEVSDFLAEFGLDTENLEDASKRIPLALYQTMLERQSS